MGRIDTAPIKCKKCSAIKQKKRACFFGFACHKNGMPPMAAGLVKIGKE